MMKACDGGVHLERAAWVYAGLAILAAMAAYLLMDNLGTAKSRPASSSGGAQAADLDDGVPLHRHLRVVHRLLGRDAAPHKRNFWVPEPSPLGTGIYFAYFAFLGALVGSATRPLGGWLADKFGGAKVTLGAFCAMVVCTLMVLWTLTQLTPNPTADPAIAADNESWFPFLAIR